MKQLLFGVLLFLSFFSLTAKTIAAFDPLEVACSGNGGESVACTESQSGQTGENPVTGTTQKVVNIVSVAIGAGAVIVIIVAGITMTLSQGDSGKIKSSRDTIIYAAVGLVVTGLARAIVMFILNSTR